MVCGSNTYERRYPVKVHAFCLSASASESGKISPTASLTHDDGERSWQISMEWTNLPLLQAPVDNPAEFLYAVLWSMMTDFDDHLVTRAVVNPSLQDGS